MLADTEVAQGAVGRGEAGANRHLPGRFFLHVDFQVGAVGLGAVGGFDLGGFKKAKVFQILFRLVDDGGVVRVAFSQANLAANDLVDGAVVAGDVDAAHIHPLALLDVEVQVDGQIVFMLVRHGGDGDEGILLVAQGGRQLGHRLFNLVGVVPFAFTHIEERLQGIGVEALDLAGDGDLAEMVARALFEGVGQEEIAARFDDADQETREHRTGQAAQPADDGDPERTAQFRAGPEGEGQR